MKNKETGYCRIPICLAQDMTIQFAYQGNQL